MDGDHSMAILEDELQQTLEFYVKSVDDIICQQDNDPNVTSKCRNGLKIITLQSPSGLHSLRTLVPLNTVGIISIGD